MTALCRRFDTEGLTALESGRPLPTHFQECGVCIRRRVEFERMATELARADRIPAPAAAWRARVRAVLDVPERQPRRSRRWLMAVATATTVPVFVGLALLVGRLNGADRVFATLMAEPRQHEWRVTLPVADRYRPYSPARSPREPTTVTVDLGPVDEAGDWRSLATAQLLVGMLGQAEGNFAALPETADSLNDRAAILIEREQPAEAIAVLKRALEQAPRHVQATWNMAVALEKQGDREGAARRYEQAAALAEPGWSDEAEARAARLRGLR